MYISVAIEIVEHRINPCYTTNSHSDLKNTHEPLLARIQLQMGYLILGVSKHVTLTHSLTQVDHILGK